jgi:nitrite reductase/ring-hydroxylating ferredoxin subunit
VPCGGPPVFLPGDGVFLDDDDLLARVAAVAPDVAARVRVLDPGGAARADGEAWTFDQPRPAADRRAARGTLRLARAPEREARLAALRAEAPPLDAKDLRSYARDLFQYEDMTWDMKVLVELRATGGPSVWVDFRKRPVRHLTEMAEPADFVVSADAAFVSLVLKGALTWHELLAAGELAVDRPAGRDATALLNHFVYRHDPAAFDLVRWENPALMTTSDDSFEYKCQRFCPHRGRDLEYGILERGKLTCTAHNWRFDLRNGGKCLWGGDRPLLVKEVRPLTRG